MKQLTDQQIAEYFHRSFTAADGLWFVKVEEKYGFDAALEIDNEVWKVLPKIQARKMKSLLNAPAGHRRSLRLFPDPAANRRIRIRDTEGAVVVIAPTVSTQVVGAYPLQMATNSLNTGLHGANALG